VNSQIETIAIWEPLINLPPFPEYTSGHATVDRPLRVALEAAMAVPLDHRRSEALIEVFRRLRPEEREGLFREALKPARAADGDRWRAGTHKMLARRLAREGRADEAIAVGSDVTDVRQRTEILTELTRLLVADGRPADALRAVSWRGAS
jgi:hypothetical protein